MGRYRQADCESRSLTLDAGYADIPTVSFYDPFDNRQAQASALSLFIGTLDAVKLGE